VLRRVGHRASAQERGEQAADARPPSRPKARGKRGAGHGWPHARLGHVPSWVARRGGKGAWGFYFPFLL
jgi:hypothetical protein